MTYSRMATSHTTIGAERFHFRVRNGIGWFPLAMTARQVGYQRSVIVAASADSESCNDECRIRVINPTRIQAAWVLYGQASRAISTG